MRHTDLHERQNREDDLIRSFLQELGMTFGVLLLSIAEHGHNADAVSAYYEWNRTIRVETL